MTVQSSIIEHLLNLIDDRELAERIRARYYLDVEAQTNFAQAQFIDIAMRLERSFDEKVTNQFGATNEMISESVALAREGGVALRELRNDFQETINTLIVDVRSLQQTALAHDREIASFRKSRDQSIADRLRHTRELAEIRDDSASIHEELQQARVAREEMAAMVEEIKAMLIVQRDHHSDEP